MIVSDLTTLRGQVALTANLEKAIDFLIEHGGEEFPIGRQVIDGDSVYAEVQAYETVDDSEWRFEGHRSYLDIQYVVEGSEIIGWASIDDVEVTTPYVEAGDYWLGVAPAEKVTGVRLHAGQLAVLYPEDAHAPRRADGAVSPVRKLVVKVAIDATAT
ncbi:MAG: YhcH/YjgK/YiaL family protein [Thermomicrobiales bacterium]